MRDVGDFELNKGVDAGGPQQRSLGRKLLIAALVIAIAGVAIYLGARYWRTTSREVRLQTEQAVVPSAGASKPVAEPGDNIPLPPLDQMDPLVRELVAQLSSHPMVAAWLTTDGLVQNFTVIVINVAGGQTPAKHLRKLAPGAPFATVTRDGVSYIDARSYERYDRYADAVAGLDARGTARLYATLKPRIQDAANELGERDDFNITLERAIRQMLATPIIERPIEVKQAPVLWVYADPKLEGPSHAQRQLLRAGPRNVRLIQAKLREIAPHIGIAPETLPTQTVIR